MVCVQLASGALREQDVRDAEADFRLAAYQASDENHHPQPSRKLEGERRTGSNFGSVTCFPSDSDLDAIDVMPPSQRATAEHHGSADDHLGAEFQSDAAPEPAQAPFGRPAIPTARQ